MSNEILSQIEKIGTAWEQSKKAQDELDGKLEKGLAVSLRSKQNKKRSTLILIKPWR